MSKKEMIKIGLTGIMGAGKSSVITILKECGLMILDCDQINALLLQKKEAGYEQLIHTFGTIFLDAQGDIDKAKLSQLIFKDVDKKKQAERILHPLIKEKIKEAFVRYQYKPAIVVEVPLLFEINWQDEFDEIWVVASEESILLERLSQFRGISSEEAKRRLSHQMSQEEKIERADIVFYNNHDKDHLKKQIYAILDGKHLR